MLPLNRWPSAYSSLPLLLKLPVSSTQIEAAPVPVSHRADGSWIKQHLLDLLLPGSLALWALGVSRTNAANVGHYGLPPLLPPVYYAGIALLVISASIELIRSRMSAWRMALHATALVVMLYGTAPLVYQEGRYGWLYKTIGVVQYINAHGQLNPQIDIYQNWPGFFALAGWFDKVAGVGSPLAYAKWAQLVFELAALPLLYLSYDALSLTFRQRWVALMLYSASNWVGQDYLSPQALGTILSLGIMALAMRWLSMGNFSGRNKRARELRADTAPRAPDQNQLSHPARFAMCCTLLLVFFVLTFTHELSPYLLAVQLGLLMVPRLLRPRWLPLALAAVALGYLLPHFTFVNQNFGILSSLGNFFGNVAPPSSATGHLVPPHSVKVIEECQKVLSLSMWGLALVGAWVRRRSKRTVLTLLILAFSPFLLLALIAYGNEGILRVYLFSLPWTAALAASAVAPAPSLVRQIRSGWGKRRRRPANSENRDGELSLRRLLDALRIALALAFMLTLFFPSFFGDDSFNVIPASEVTAMTSLQQNYPVGPVYSASGNGAEQDTSRYNLFSWLTVFGDVVAPGAPVHADIANVIAQNAYSYTGGLQPAYVVVAPSMVAYNASYAAVTDASSFSTLLNSLARSHVWKLIDKVDGTYIYELPMASEKPPSASARPRPRPRTRLSPRASVRTSG